MRKKDELSLDNTCMAHAHPEEMVFVLLGRDAAAPVAIYAWTAERLRLGKNVGTDAQIVEAMSIAETMEREGRRWVEETALRAPAPSYDELREALAESVKLQSHYAVLLNQHDGGRRHAFSNTHDWVQRLRDLKRGGS